MKVMNEKVKRVEQCVTIYSSLVQIPFGGLGPPEAIWHPEP